MIGVILASSLLGWLRGKGALHGEMDLHGRFGVCTLGLANRLMRI